MISLIWLMLKWRKRYNFTTGNIEHFVQISNGDKYPKMTRQLVIVTIETNRLYQVRVIANHNGKLSTDFTQQYPGIRAHSLMEAKIASIIRHHNQPS